MKYFRPFFLAAMSFFCLLVISCNNNLSGPDSRKLSYELLSETLEKAYQQESQEQLDTFFEDWDEMIEPISSDEFIAHAEVEQEAYRLFVQFYTPDNLDRLTNGEHENFETGFRYIAVQNKLEIAVADTNPKYYYYRGVNISEYSIDNFRPELPNLASPAVYLTEEADSIIYYFLFDPDSTYRDDSSERAEFLRQAMQLTPHHWITDYHKYTMPHAGRIIFNETYAKALIQFRVFFQFGDAYFEKENGNWVLKESELTAIE